MFKNKKIFFNHFTFKERVIISMLSFLFLTMATLTNFLHALDFKNEDCDLSNSVPSLPTITVLQKKKIFLTQIYRLIPVSISAVNPGEKALHLDFQE